MVKLERHARLAKQLPPRRSMWWMASTSRRRWAVVGTVASTVAILLLTTACNSATGRFQARPRLLRDRPVNLVAFDGVGRVPFGAPLMDVRDQLTKSGPGCDGSTSYGVPGYVGHADLIFAEGRFQMAWIYSPELHTADGVAVGDHIDEARTAHPGAEEHLATDRSLPALLVRSGDTAIIYLYEPGTNVISKMVAGYADQLQAGLASATPC